MNETLKYAIVAKNVSFSYAKHWNSMVLKSVNLNVAKGEIYGLLGPSGSGKTTLLKLIIGLRKPDKGDISVFGYKPGSIESGTPGIGVGYMPQEISLPNLMTITEVFKYFGSIYLLDNELIEIKMRYFLKTLKLNDDKALIRNLSGGEKRRVSLAIALFSSPRLLILDEPTVGVDPLLRQTIWSYLERLTQESNTTIIVTTHYIEEMRYATTVAFMRKCEILEEKKPCEVIEEHNCPDLESVFLELCLKQKEPNQFTRKKLSVASYKNCLTLNQEKTSVVEPMKEQTFKHRFVSEILIIKAVILKTLNYYWRIGGFILACFCSLYGIFLSVYCIGKNPTDIPMGWIADEKPNCSLMGNIDGIPYLPDLLLSNINQKVINIIKYETVEAALEDAKRSKIIGYIHLKQNFSENFYKRDLLIIDDSEYISNDAIDSGSVHLYLDSTNLILQQLIFKSVFQMVTKFREKAFMEIGIDSNVSGIPFEIAEPIHGTIATEHFTQYTKNTVVSFMVLICFILSMFLASDAVTTDISSDVYGRSIAAGLKPHQLIIGELISRCLFMSSVAAINFVYSIYVFNVSLKGSLLLAIINMMLNILSGVSLGALIAVFIHSPFFCHIFVTAASVSIAMLSGTFWSVDALPYFIKTFIPLIPGTLPITAMLKIFNYECIDFVTHILPAFVSSVSTCVFSSVVTCYSLTKLAL